MWSPPNGVTPNYRPTVGQFKLKSLNWIAWILICLTFHTDLYQTSTLLGNCGHKEFSLIRSVTSYRLHATSWGLWPLFLEAFSPVEPKIAIIKKTSCSYHFDYVIDTQIAVIAIKDSTLRTTINQISDLKAVFNQCRKLVVFPLQIYDYKPRVVWDTTFHFLLIFN